MNGITLNWKKINHFIGEKERTIQDRAYTKEEIRRMLNNLNKMLDSFMEEEKMIRRKRKRRNDYHQMLCWQAMEANGRDQVRTLKPTRTVVKLKLEPSIIIFVIR